MLTALLSAVALLQASVSQQPDPDTRAWWQRTSVLSADSMEGRDAGSRGYEHAARHVARWLAAAGVKPLGDSGTFFQSVPMEEVAVTRARLDVGGRPLRFLHDVTIPAQTAPHTLAGALAYRGYCGADILGDVRGRLVICHAARRPGLPTNEQRRAALVEAGAAGMISIADPGFTIEPPRWPAAYARSVALAGTAPRVTPAESPGFVTLSLRAGALGVLLGPSGQNADSLIAAGSAGRPLPAFDLRDSLRASFDTRRRALRSPNVVGILPGTDPSKANEAIVLTAHLDGYGYGTPVNGDSLYNGTLDDAAYVALVVRLLERRNGQGFRRPVIVAIVTGEEKGLLGSRWFLAHLPPSVPRERIAGNINLDQLRPLFPLELLTVHALDDTSLGDDARAVAESLGIAVQHDPEPERGLLQRTDHWPFLQAGIPAVNFVFGYRPGTESERIYRQWYREGYHTPKDDLNQRIDWKAAADFSGFYYALVARVAGQDSAPSWKPAQAASAPPPLYTDLGTLSHPIRIGTSRAQAYFDQGLRLYYGFNSEEAVRAFREAARLDPSSPMPHWGIAMALGPNVNISMDSAAEREARAEMLEAARLAGNGSARDRAYVAAIADRYAPIPGTERGRRDTLYVAAMRNLVKRHPDDQDAAVLLAESLMLLHPWDWFRADGTPVGSILEAIDNLERVTRTNPRHPGACHFYIHAVEQSSTPARALPCADRLAGLMPGAGHIVHMPAHIYMRTGNYAEAVRRNQHAAHADQRFIGEQKPKGVYPLYLAHNLHFLWAAAAMDGQAKVSLKAARDLVASVPPELYEQAPLFEMIAAVPALALARFERWGDLSSEPAPKTTLKLARALWHHARGVAYARTGKVELAERELAALRALAAEIPRDQLVMTTNTAPQVTDLAAKVVEAEIALARGRTPEGVALLTDASRLEDGLRYDEPATWYSPVRQRLGRVLLTAGRPAEAERAFREDLMRNPENGWSLDGLAKSLAAQGKVAESASVTRRFARAWTRADVRP